MIYDPEELYNELYEDRLLVFLECDDHFHQISLDKTQFKKVSDACIKEFGKINPKTKNQQITVKYVENVLLPKKVFDNLSSIHDELQTEKKTLKD